MTDERSLFDRRDDPEARAELVERHDPLASRLARRFTGRGESLEDLLQVARLGLLGAIDRFDPDRGVAFSTFAGRTIVGELKRHLRDKAWSVRVPRGLQEQVLEVTATVERLTQRLGRSPTLRQIAAEIDSEVETVIEALEAGDAYTAASVDAPVAGRDGARPLIDRMGEPDPHLERTAERVIARDLLDALPERERSIVVQRFLGGKTQSEIARSIGISQMHVSRLLRSSVARLHEAVSETRGSR